MMREEDILGVFSSILESEFDVTEGIEAKAHVTVLMGRRSHSCGVAATPPWPCSFLPATHHHDRSTSRRPSRCGVFR